ncbi:MAG: zinc ribbon domain-containing protein [Trichodesmium sp. MO_231.B1]|nr:zinc ribbon domain-containing protein [Trichodesmium sp. MO_231.B1]
MPLSVRTYECGNCGFEGDRDLNAAVNLENYVNK